MKSMSSELPPLTLLAGRGCIFGLGFAGIGGTGGTFSPFAVDLILFVRSPPGEDERDAEAPLM